MIKNFIILIVFVLSFSGIAQTSNDTVIFLGTEKVDKKKLQLKRIFYEKCPGVSSINCYRNILFSKNNIVDTTAFIDDDDDFGKGLRYKLSEEVVVLDLPFLLLGKSKSFWKKYFQINKFNDVKSKVKNETTINDTIFYQDLQYKIREVLVYKVKVDFLNEKILSRNIGIISDKPYVTVYVVGGIR